MNVKHNFKNLRSVLYSCDSKNGDIQNVDALLDTIASLNQKVYSLEQTLVEVRHFAYHDELTGLANRSLLRDRLNQAMKQADRHHKQVGLLMLDLNGFKNINDNFGHNIGDALLKKVAKRLASSIRTVDSAFRYGGDEFMVLLPEVDGMQGAKELMCKLYAHLSKAYTVASHHLVVTASIGIAVYPANGTNQTDLIKHADGEMYQAKTDGPSMYQSARR